MKKLCVATALAALSFTAPSQAAAEEPREHRTVVSTAGLDLATVKGQRRLTLRILHAASALCETPSAADPLGWKTYISCRDEAMARADTQRRLVVASATARTSKTIASVQ
ncbi:MAG: UrcA family protein [Acetobacteraceae bacterium]|nr:UrcA family protein [Acetobacteraceae bacterium]